MHHTVAWTAAATLALSAGAACLGAAGVVLGGLYDVAASTQHTQAVYSLMETAFERSVRRRARSIQAPALGAPDQLVRGATCYRDHCLACHGAPGVAPGPAALAMQPLPGPLVDAAALWRPRDLYWITRNGIRMTGMPAWEYRLSEADLWAVTAFVARLSQLAPAEWGRQLASLQAGACAVSAR